MKVRLSMATSLNGMIARPDDSTDFLAHAHWRLFVQLVHQTGALVWGRKTHEEIRRYGPAFLADLRGVRGMVVSRDPALALEEGWQQASSVDEACARFAAQQVDAVVLSGGATLNTAFARAGRIDEVILTIEPVVIGAGIPLFTAAPFDLRLQLQQVERVHDEIIRVHYIVSK